MSQSVYPLIPDMSSENAKIPRLRIGKEAQKKSKEEIEFQEKIRIEREEFKKSLKRKQESPASEVAELNKKQKIESNEEAINEESEEIEKDNTEDTIDTENVTGKGQCQKNLTIAKVEQFRCTHIFLYFCKTSCNINPRLEVDLLYLIDI